MQKKQLTTASPLSARSTLTAIALTVTKRENATLKTLFQTVMILQHFLKHGTTGSTLEPKPDWTLSNLVFLITKFDNVKFGRAPTSVGAGNSIIPHRSTFVNGKSGKNKIRTFSRKSIKIFGKNFFQNPLTKSRPSAIINNVSGRCKTIKPCHLCNRATADRKKFFKTP